MHTPKWLKILFTAVMLAFCCVICWSMITGSQLEKSKVELTQKLETSLGREKKQQVEYDQVMLRLPLQAATLEELLPKANAAKEEEDQLRARRKVLRGDISALQDALSAVEAPDSALCQLQTQLCQYQSDLNNTLLQLEAMLHETQTILMLLQEHSPLL